MTDSPAQPKVHLIFSVAGFEAVRQRCAPQEPLVLIGDGVYCLPLLQTTDAVERSLYALSPDIEQRSIASSASTVTVTVINDLDLVDLIAAHANSVSWR